MTLLETMVTPRHRPLIVSTYRSYSHSPTDAQLSTRCWLEPMIESSVRLQWFLFQCTFLPALLKLLMQSKDWGLVEFHILKQCVMKFSSLFITSFSLTTDEYKLIRKTINFLHPENVCLKFLLNEVIEAFF